MNELELLKQQVIELTRKVNSLESFETISYEVDSAFRTRLAAVLSLPDGFEDAPLTSVTSPSGGATIDTQARSAIDTIITRLEDLGLILPN